MSKTDIASLLDPVCNIARRAGAETMVYYRSDLEIREKADQSPVTVADEAAERVILAGLRSLTPEIPVVAEEEAAAGRIPEISGVRFWLVDPLDGTKEFVRHSDEFTVNIGLIENGAPVLGVVFAPALERLFAAAGPGTAICADGTAPARPISARAVPADGAVVVASKSHGDPDALARLVRSMPVSRQVSAGSSLKFCLVAAGEADIYPRYGNTCEWDTAAGHAVLVAAGGSVRTLDGQNLVYGKAKFLNPEFVARGLD